jgi:hypothetical protein
MCFYDSILTFIAFLTHHIKLHNFFVDVLGLVCLSANDYDARSLLVFDTVALIRNYINTFI